MKQALLKQNCSVYFDGVETFGASPNSDDSRISLAFPTTGTATLPDGSTTLYILKILSCAADSNDKAQSVGEALWAATEIAYL
ncbi:MAG TPA: hypothetical protein VFF06_16395 [Polyangia bacterium]|nr:hypothetical protein [Polyangia bacterium]